jgi:hypothetical protein
VGYPENNAHLFKNNIHHTKQVKLLASQASSSSYTAAEFLTTAIKSAEAASW